MIEIGIHTNTFQNSSLEEILKSVKKHGLSCIQFKMDCVGLSSLPEVIDDTICSKISDAMKNSGIRIAVISGYFNAIHPDKEIRSDGIARVSQLISKCSLLGTNIVALCTGTRNTEDMWKYHKDNETDSAWRDLIFTFSELCRAADRYQITLAFEPEIVNVVNNSQKAKKIIKEIGSKFLKVLIDPANLITKENINRMDTVIEEAIELLGLDIVLAHAKDIDPINPEEIRLPAGKGCLNYGVYMRTLKKIGYAGALILHGLKENEIQDSIKFLRKHYASI